MKLSMSFRAKILSHHYYSEAKPKNLIFLTRVKRPDASLPPDCVKTTILFSVD